MISQVIVFFEHGRLGNQLFQYAALKELYPNQRLVFFGFEALKQALEHVDAIIIEKTKLPGWLRFALKKFLLVLAKLRIIGTIQEIRKNSTSNVKKIKGAISIYYLKTSYFQHQTMLDKINPHLNLTHHKSHKALEWIKQNISQSSKQNLVFIHIRRGDYLTWPSREHPAVLDKQWYIRAMDQMRTKVRNPFFLLLSDDPYYAKDCFGDQPNMVISENDQMIDLALMSHCQHGILSASSYAWWGACFSKTRRHEGGIYLAPKYWGGHRKAAWVPEDFITNWLTYIE